MAGPAGRFDKLSFPENPSQALEAMMTDYGTAVLRTAHFYMGDRHLAEDASQEAFIRAYRNWSSFRGDCSVKTWLTRITVNVCRDKLGLKMASEQLMDPQLLQHAERDSAEDEALVRYSRTLILKHVAKLPPHYHEVIYFYYYMELSTREIAEATGTPEGTVRGRLHRARELLGEHLKKEGLVQ
ncbi:sigma-70 family RNA polymerase sigma factor [Paenibacillus mendelii]|uniref:Sigma-70 family RNA polymerase sigma factor n=1 Tax=Paenibacillus mendelii TaxID=206163 RepID=A0ABV6JA28_9BACL|nr:sigma-70 family RNA polymerase sigma factor [Paenibacillus mendelii]MCQ6560980.1 sigma-70 family RNA polymerase sigma factor [Paenibacillus mendelii]